MLVGPTQGAFSPQSTKTERCCPRCGGTTGHQHVMTESHKMFGRWGESAESLDSGGHVRPVVRSLVVCADCGAKFKHAALTKLGLT